eukprot:5310113-Ditylum_brightwellii.AAC.1
MHLPSIKRKMSIVETTGLVCIRVMYFKLNEIRTVSYISLGPLIYNVKPCFTILTASNYASLEMPDIANWSCKGVENSNLFVCDIA